MGDKPHLLFLGALGKAKEGLHKGCPDIQKLVSRVSGTHPVLDDLVDIIVHVPAECSLAFDHSPLSI